MPALKIAQDSYPHIVEDIFQYALATWTIRELATVRAVSSRLRTAVDDLCSHVVLTRTAAEGELAITGLHSPLPYLPGGSTDRTFERNTRVVTLRGPIDKEDLERVGGTWISNICTLRAVRGEQGPPTSDLLTTLVSLSTVVLASPIAGWSDQLAVPNFCFEATLDEIILNVEVPSVQRFLKAVDPEGSDSAQEYFNFHLATLGVRFRALTVVFTPVDKQSPSPPALRNASTWTSLYAALGVIRFGRKVTLVGACEIPSEAFGFPSDQDKTELQDTVSAYSRGYRRAHGPARRVLARRRTCGPCLGALQGQAQLCHTGAVCCF